MNTIKSFFEKLLFKRVAASVAQFTVSFATAHAFGSAGPLSDFHWVSPTLGVDLVIKLTVDGAVLETGLFVLMITGTEWARHWLAERYPDKDWL